MIAKKKKKKEKRKKKVSALLAKASRPARGDNAGVEVEGREWGVIIVFEMSQPLC